MGMRALCRWKNVGGVCEEVYAIRTWRNGRKFHTLKWTGPMADWRGGHTLIR